MQSEVYTYVCVCVCVYACICALEAETVAGNWEWDARIREWGLTLAWQPISIPARFLKANLAQAAHFFAHFMSAAQCLSIILGPWHFMMALSVKRCKTCYNT